MSELKFRGVIKTARVTPLAQLCDRFDGREKTLVAWRVFVRWQVNDDALVVIGDRRIVRRRAHRCMLLLCH